MVITDTVKVLEKENDMEFLVMICLQDREVESFLLLTNFSKDSVKIITLRTQLQL